MWTVGGDILFLKYVQVASFCAPPWHCADDLLTEAYGILPLVSGVMLSACLFDILKTILLQFRTNGLWARERKYRVLWSGVSK